MRVVGSIPYGGPIEQFFGSSQFSMNGIRNAVVCAILSVGWGI